MKNGSIFQGVGKMKTKKIFTARITADDELLAMLGPDRIGGMESWFLMSQGASYSVFLFVPDLNKTDAFSFDVLFEDNFLKNNEVKIGDRFPIAIPFPRTLRQIEIIDIQEGEPINNHENKRPVRQSNKSVSQFLSYYLYHHLEPDEVCGEDGWFNIEALFKYLATIGYLVDQDQLETIVNKDGDHRYILSDDKTKLRVNPEHPAPKHVEDGLKNVDDLKIKRSAFMLSDLPFKKDRKRSILVSCSNGNSYSFPYETNKIFFMDKKRFFMLIEEKGCLMLAVSPYMTKNLDKRWRMYIKALPELINNYFSFDAVLVDFDGISYKVTIEDHKRGA